MEQVSPTLEDRFNRLNIAAKALKIASENAMRLIHVDPAKAEDILIRALIQAEQDGL